MIRRVIPILLVWATATAANYALPHGTAIGAVVWWTGFIPWAWWLWSGRNRPDQNRGDSSA